MATLRDTVINGDLSVTGKISGGFLGPGDVLSTRFGGACTLTSSNTRLYFTMPCPPSVQL